MGRIFKDEMTRSTLVHLKTIMENSKDAIIYDQKV